MLSFWATASHWARAHDRGFSSLRRAARTAIVMPAVFALGDKALGDATLATFAAFGAFATLLLVDFGGPIRSRLQTQAGLVIAGGALVCLGTLASQTAWSAACGMAVAGFAILFAGVVSSVLAGATTALLMAFVLPVTLAGPVSSIPDRLAGWGLAGALSLPSISLLWPAPARNALRSTVISACRALALDLLSSTSGPRVTGMVGTQSGPATASPVPESPVANLRAAFFATPNRPTSLSTSGRALVRLVDEIGWLGVIVAHAPTTKLSPATAKTRLAAARALQLGADVLEAPGDDDKDLRPALTELREAMTHLREALAELQEDAAAALPPAPGPGTDGSGVDSSGAGPSATLVANLGPAFRAQELAFATAQVAANIQLAVAAERRSWTDRLLGRQPAGLGGTFGAAHERAASYWERHSVWLHNSVRGAVGLGLAVWLAGATNVQHSLWVVLGALSVLRSNALSTGQTVLRALGGTLAGFVAGAALLALIGTNTTVLWCLLPLAILFAGFAPAAISFVAGQAGFTVTMVLLFNIVQPAGWRIGLVRVEDIALGCLVSLVVGCLFWPRGAAAALGQALREAYADSAAYLAAAVEFGLGRCDGTGPVYSHPGDQAARSAASARRLDDTFRSYLAERGAKTLPLADVTTLVTGVAGLRLASDAVLDLWEGDDGQTGGDRSAARRELRATDEAVVAWYRAFADSLGTDEDVPDVLGTSDPGAGQTANARLVDAVSHDLRGGDGRASAAAVRMVWTANHLEAARRLQMSLAGPARAAKEQHALTPFGGVLPHPTGR